jgi:tape measure domain-containing protein
MAATLDASLRLDSSQFTSGLDASMKKTNAAVSKMSAAFSTLKNIAVGGAIGSSFLDVARSVGTAYLEAEKLQNALKATAGSDVLGMKQYEELRKLSSQIGINMELAAKSSLQLRAVGMTAVQSLSTIKTLQNAIRSTGGGSEELSRLLYGLKQLYGSAKPLQEEINQINEAFALAPALFNKAFGTTRAEELQKLGLSGKQVAEALIKMAEALPQVERGMGGAIDTLNARFKNLLVVTGEATSSFAKPVIEGTNFVLASIDFLVKSRQILSDYEKKKKAGVDFGVEDEDNRKIARALERQQKAEKDRLQAIIDAKKLQDSLNEGNEKNRELDAISWQNQERWQQERDRKDKEAQDDAKKAADQAIADAKELLSLHEDTVRKIKSVQESVYSAQQSMAGSDADRLANAKKALEAEGKFLMGDDPGGFDKLTMTAFEDAVKAGRNVTEGQVEQYNRIIGLKEEILGLEQSITDEAKNGAAELRDQNREAVQRSIEKAGRTPAERKQEMRDNNDMQRQRRRAFNDDVRDEMTRLKKEAEEKNKGRNILDRERTDREDFKEAAKANIAKKWQDALPEAAQTLIDIKDILKGLAAA